MRGNFNTDLNTIKILKSIRVEKDSKIIEEYEIYSYDEWLKTKGYIPPTMIGTFAKITGIYGIYNTITEKWYVGQSSNVWKRNSGELRELRNYEFFNAKLKRDCIKYGVDSFKFFILEFCKISELTDRENFWIDCKNAIKNGYNSKYECGEKIRKSKRVVCLNNGLIFKDVYTASDYADASPYTLKSAISRGKSCGGCLWKYEE